MPRYHDAPWLTVADQDLLLRFLAHYGIDGSLPADPLIAAVTGAFARLPFENLTKIIKADGVVSARSAMRYPDELLADHLRWGTGGTCFSLTASLVAVFDALGVEAHPVLADRHYGPDTHSGVILVRPGGEVLLLDPGYLLFAPVPVPVGASALHDNGFNRVELRPVPGGRVELWTIVKNNRKLRLTFRLRPVGDAEYGAAWERSFAFEMMAYPVLTRCVGGQHQYVQGATLAVRNAHRTVRRELSRSEQVGLIRATFGIDERIAVRALEIVKYGRHLSPPAG